MKKSILLPVLISAGIYSYAQNNTTAQPKVLVDGIAAIVGDGIVLKSDVDLSLEQYKHQSKQTFLPPEMKCYIVSSFIQNKVLAIQAQKDSLPITDDQIEQELDGRINAFVRQYGSKESVEKIVNKPLYQYKEDMRQQVKEQALAQAAQQNIIRNIRITPAEVEEYYKSIPVDSLRYKESQYEVSQLVMDPKPSKEAEDALIAQMTKWKNELEAGKADFMELAKQYSEEPSAKQTGGQFSINKDAGGIDPVFMTAAFKLKEGQISPVVKTSFGYHIIQMVSKVGSDAVVRHIIKLPPLGDKEVRESIERADSLRTIIINNKIPFNTAVNRFSDDENLKYTGGAVAYQSPYGGFESVLTLDQFTDKQIADAITKMNVGDISDAQIFQNPQTGKLQVRLLYLRSKTEPHRENLKDDFNEIAQRALSIKQNMALGNWLHKNIGNYYIKVSDDYNDCPEIKEWTKLSEESLNHFSTR